MSVLQLTHWMLFKLPRSHQSVVINYVIIIFLCQKWKSIMITQLYHSFLLELRKEAAFLVKVNLLSAGLVTVRSLYGFRKAVYTFIEELLRHHIWFIKSLTYKLGHSGEMLLWSCTILWFFFGFHFLAAV